jgi:hypothetical protein
MDTNDINTQQQSPLTPDEKQVVQCLKNDPFWNMS